MSDEKGLTLKARPVRCGEEAQDIWRVRADYDFGDGKGPVPVVAEFDLNPEDNKDGRDKEPQVRLDGGAWSNVDVAFVREFRELTKVSAPAGEGEKLCFKPSLTFTPKAEIGYIKSAVGGSEHEAYTGSFYKDDGPKVTGGLLFEAKPIRQLKTILEISFGSGAPVTQPLLLTNDGYFDAPQTYLQMTFGAACFGAGRRWARAGMPVEMSLPSIGGYSARAFTQHVVEGGYCSEDEKTALWFGVGTGGDLAWKDDNNVPNGLVDFSHDFGPIGVWAHFEVDPQGENKDLRFDWDASLRFGDGTWKGLIYGFGGVQEVMDEWQHAAAVYGQLMIEPEKSYVGGKLRFGFNDLDPYRTGLESNIRVLQTSGGLSVYPWQNVSILELSGLIDYQVPVDGQAIYNGDKHLVRFQLVAKTVYPFNVELGK